MKKFPANRRFSQLSGFTLVELLVVIAIIAILAAVILSAGNMALRAAERAKTANMASQIQTATLGYYTEYSVYPVPSTFTTAADWYIADTDAADWGNLIEALSGNISPYNPTATVTPTVANTRGIAFLSLKATDVDLNNAPLSSLTYSTAHPYFNIVMDSDYSGLVGDTGTAVGTMPDFTKSTVGSIVYLTKGATGGVAVWANSNTTTTITKWSPGFFEHTY